jgi:hypothetical protein
MDGSQVYFAGRICFEELVPLYGSGFSGRVTAAWPLGAAGYQLSSVNAAYYALRRLLRWLAIRGSSDHFVDCKYVYERILDGRLETIHAADWAEVVRRYALEIRDGICPVSESKTPKAKRAAIEHTNLAIRVLGAGGLLPSVRVNNPKMPDTQGRGLASLGEIGSEQLISSDLKGAFDQLMTLSDARLRALRQHAEDVLCAAEAKINDGNHYLAAPGVAPLSADDLIYRLNTIGLRGLGKRLSEQELRTDREEKRRLIIAYFKHSCDGWVRRSDNRLDNAIRRAGFSGYTEVREFLEGNIFAAIAAQTIVLIDTGMNIECSDNISAQPFRSNARYGEVALKIISETKMRANGQAYEVPLADWVFAPKIHPDARLSSVRAIEIWQLLSQPFRARAIARGDDVARYLWTAPVSKSRDERLQALTPVHIQPMWKAFLRRAKDPFISSGVITRSMIRPTFLQLRHAEANFNTSIPQLLANHSSTRVTKGYTGRAWLKERLDALIRDFQRSFEAVVGSSIDNFADLIGEDETEFDQLSDNARASGLGFLCAGEFNTIHSSSQTCIEITGCPNCPSRKFVANEGSIRDLLVFNLSLKVAADTFISVNASRWLAVWLPYLALTEATLAKLENSHRKALVVRLRREISSAFELGELNLVELW